MKIIMYGVNNDTVTKDHINRYDLSENERSDHLKRISQFAGVYEVVLVKTKYRLEYYLCIDETTFSHGDLLRFIAEHSEKSLKEVILETYSKFNQDVVSHLAFLTTAINSVVENVEETLLNINYSWIVAQRHGTSSKFLDDLFLSTINFSLQLQTNPIISPIRNGKLAYLLNFLSANKGDTRGKNIILFGNVEALAYYAIQFNSLDANHIVLVTEESQQLKLILKSFMRFKRLKNKVKIRTYENLDLSLAFADYLIFMPGTLLKKIPNRLMDIRTTPKNVELIDYLAIKNWIIGWEEHLSVFFNYHDDLENKSFSDDEVNQAKHYLDETIVNLSDEFFKQFQVLNS